MITADKKLNAQCKQNLKKQPTFAKKHIDAIKKQNANMPKEILSMLQK